MKIFEKFFRGYAVLEEVFSPFNGKIQVLEDIFGKKRLVVGRLTQSGNSVEKIWKKVINHLPSTINHCLILGLGAGSAARVVFRLFPGAKIVGIEIDPEIIRLGRKYFGLAEIPNLEIQIADAITTICHTPYAISKLDLILVDLYLGDKVPEKAETEEFIKKVKKSLAPSGMAIFNQLYYSKKIEKTDKFGEKLRKIFPKIEAKKIETNKLFLCRNINIK